MTIGEKIKKARASLSMTQAELAGDTVTRNMLSAIETGKANPSLQTLMYISEKLELPISYFLTDDADMDSFKKAKLMPRIKQAFKEHKYDLCQNLISELSMPDDEIYYMLAHINCEIGISCAKSGALKRADKHLRLSLSLSQKTFYNTDYIKITAPLYMSVANNISSPLLEFDAFSYTSHLQDMAHVDFYKYLIGEYDFDFKNEHFKSHLEAKQLIKERKYYDAIRILSRLEEEKSKIEYNAYFVFSVYSDLENCYKAVCDFENAYKYSSKRISLLDAFNS